MSYAPDCLSSDDECGLSDDNEYYEFKEKLKASQRAKRQVEAVEADVQKSRLRSIFTAVLNEDIEFVLREVENEANIDVDLELGWTPLLLASTLANPNLISAFLEKGANVNQTKDCNTPLMLLCNINSTEDSTEQNILACVKLLLSKNANINCTDNRRRTAIMLAAYNGHLETVKLLLPLTDKYAEDNQRWNVLFWAVDGNHVKIVEFLLSEGFSTEKTDVRGNTVVDIAHINGLEKISDLFPIDPFNEFYLRMNSNDFNFEDTFNNLGNNEKPQFFNDICKILYGTRSEQVMTTLQDRRINLADFLSLTEELLRETGVEFPYQRSRIMKGLYNFHKHAFRPQSIPFIKKNQIYSNIDVSATVLTCIKQLIAMEAALKFIVENRRDKLSLPESKEVNILMQKNRVQINRLTLVADQLNRRTKQWDSMLKPADRITKKRKNVPWGYLSVTIVVLSVVLLFKFK